MTEPSNNKKRRENCRRYEYYDESSRRCQEKCGENLELRCRIAELCDVYNNICKSKCFVKCHPPELYCDDFTHTCRSCHLICAAMHIDSYPDCEIHCPGLYQMHKSTTLLVSNMTTPVSSTTDMHITTSSSYMPALLSACVLVPVICLVIAGMVLGLIIWKKSNKKNRSRVQNVADIEDGSNGDSLNDVENTTSLYLQPDDRVVILNSQCHPDRGISIHNSQTEPANSEPHMSKHSTYGSYAITKEPPIIRTSLVSNGHQEHDGQHWLLQQQTYSSAIREEDSLSFDSGSSFGISLSGIQTDLVLPEDSPPSPTFAAAAAAAQLDQHPRIDYEEQIRKIKAMNWGSVCDLDLREDSALHPYGDCPAGELKLGTPQPMMQPQLDERVRYNEILKKLDYVVYHIFNRDRVTVAIRSSDITLGEARRQLIEQGIPREKLTLEKFQFDTTETSCEDDASHTSLVRPGRYPSSDETKSSLGFDNLPVVHIAKRDTDMPHETDHYNDVVREPRELLSWGGETNYDPALDPQFDHPQDWPKDSGCDTMRYGGMHPAINMEQQPHSDDESDLF